MSVGDRFVIVGFEQTNSIWSLYLTICLSLLGVYGPFIICCCGQKGLIPRKLIMGSENVSGAIWCASEVTCAFLWCIVKEITWCIVKEIHL